MHEIDYKRVYDLAPFLTKIAEMQARVGEAKQKLREAEDEYIRQIAKSADCPVDHVVITNEACMARGIRTHVYCTSPSTARGVGHRKCIFCGCDDFDGF